MRVIHPAVGCHYFRARPAVVPATLKRAATNFAAWWTEAQWVWTVCLRLLPDSVPTAIWSRALLCPSPACYPLGYRSVRIIIIMWLVRRRTLPVQQERSMDVGSVPEDRQLPGQCWVAQDQTQLSIIVKYSCISAAISQDISIAQGSCNICFNRH